MLKNFLQITTYKELTECTEGFAAGKISFLLILGPSKVGINHQVKTDLGCIQHQWLGCQARALTIYRQAYKANTSMNHCPIVLDDVRDDKASIQIVNAMTNAKAEVSWEGKLKGHKLPRSFKNLSPICLITHNAKSKYIDLADRGISVAFSPTAEIIHQRVVELDLCKDPEIMEFVGRHLFKRTSVPLVHRIYPQ